MKHLVRAGLLLAAILIAVFIVPRIIPQVVPTTSFLADYGFHRPNNAENEAEWASLPMQYAESSVCLDCHKTEYNLWEKANHRTVACENCHGPTKDHLQTREPPIIDTSRELCGTCHAKLAARPASFPQVDMNEMGGQAQCKTCHNPHDPRAGMPPKVPHSLDGRSDCQTCHNPHEPLEMIPPTIPHTLEGRTECLTCHGSQGLKKPVIPQIPHVLEGRGDCLVCHNAGGIKPFPQDHAGRTSVTCQSCHQSK